MKQYMTIIESIIIGHNGQKRIGTDIPYVIHPMAVFDILYELGIRDQNTLFASLLHDTLEDTKITQKEIVELTNTEVLEIVLLLTKEKGYIKQSYFENIAKNEKAKIIKIADRIHNLESSITTNDEFRKRYIQETEDYFLDLAAGTIFEDRLLDTLNMVINLTTR